MAIYWKVIREELPEAEWQGGDVVGLTLNREEFDAIKAALGTLLEGDLPTYDQTVLEVLADGLDVVAGVLEKG